MKIERGFKRKNIDFPESIAKSYKIEEKPGIRRGISCPLNEKVNTISETFFAIPNQGLWYSIPESTLFSSEDKVRCAIRSLTHCIHYAAVSDPEKMQVYVSLAQVLRTIPYYFPPETAHALMAVTSQ